MVSVSSGLNAYDETDDYLIELMGLKEDFPDEALEAYGKIYGRYWALMYTIAEDVTNDEEEAKDLLADTFNMVYKKAYTFSKGKVASHEKIRFCIMKWMTTIMQRIYYDHYLPEDYKQNLGPLSEDSYIIGSAVTNEHFQNNYNDFLKKAEEINRNEETFDKADSHEGHQNESENLRKVREYINKLPERDKDIVLTTYNFYVPGKYTPAHVLNDLERKWGTTRQNIRKILEKFRKSIKEELQPKMYIRQ